VLSNRGREGPTKAKSGGPARRVKKQGISVSVSVSFRTGKGNRLAALTLTHLSIPPSPSLPLSRSPSHSLSLSPTLSLPSSVSFLHYAAGDAQKAPPGVFNELCYPGKGWGRERESERESEREEGKEREG